MLYLLVTSNADGLYTVIADQITVVDCEDKVTAVSVVFAVYWILDIQYAAGHKRTMEMFEKAIYNMS